MKLTYIHIQLYIHTLLWVLSIMNLIGHTASLLVTVVMVLWLRNTVTQSSAVATCFRTTSGHLQRYVCIYSLQSVHWVRGICIYSNSSLVDLTTEYALKHADTHTEMHTYICTYLYIGILDSWKDVALCRCRPVWWDWTALWRTSTTLWMHSEEEHSSSTPSDRLKWWKARPWTSQTTPEGWYLYGWVCIQAGASSWTAAHWLQFFTFSYKPLHCSGVM